VRAGCALAQAVDGLEEQQDTDRNHDRRDAAAGPDQERAGASDETEGDEGLFGGVEQREGRSIAVGLAVSPKSCRPTA